MLECYRKPYPECVWDMEEFGQLEYSPRDILFLWERDRKVAVKGVWVCQIEVGEDQIPVHTWGEAEAVIQYDLDASQGEWKEAKEDLKRTGKFRGMWKMVDIRIVGDVHVGQIQDLYAEREVCEYLTIVNRSRGALEFKV